jgi:hypothetical protein
VKSTCYDAQDLDATDLLFRTRCIALKVNIAVPAAAAKWSLEGSVLALFFKRLVGRRRQGMRLEQNFIIGTEGWTFIGRQ